LIGLGHSRIGIITGPEWEACHLDRLDGYSAALRRAGLPLDPALVRHGNSLETGGQQWGALLLDLPDPPTAIFSCSDEQAYGVYKAARERGLKIPRDLSVMGFDDVSLCQWVTPQLTTVRQPLKDMGAAAVRTIANLANDQVQPTRYEMATQLVVRESTARPRKAKPA
jgi:LacI family transcriptional regulator